MRNPALLRNASLLLGVLGVSAQSMAATVTFSDLTAFQAATGAVAEAPLPNAGVQQNAPLTVGAYTISLGPGASNLIVGSIQEAFHPAPWTSRIAGNQIALSGVEDLNVQFSSSVFAFGFEMVEPENDPNVFAPFVDSLFTVSLFSANTNVGSFTVSPPNDAAVFVGVWSDIAFDRIEIRETVGASENEFFGQLYSGSVPLPEPGATLLLLASVGGFLVWRRLA
jgi:hypothetical protein